MLSSNAKPVTRYEYALLPGLELVLADVFAR